MDDDKALVERLRYEHGTLAGLIAASRKAADHIEAQAAEIERLTFVLQTLGGEDALTTARELDPEHDAELIARVSLARAALGETE